MMSRVAIVLVILVLSLVLITTDKHSKALTKAREWHQESLCHTDSPHQENTRAEPEVRFETVTEVVKEELVDRTHNRIACDMCQPGDVFCESIGEHNFARSIGFSGSNFRLERFINKLRSGQPVIVAAVGGSVSFGHGLFAQGYKSENKGPGNMHWRIFDWITSQYPNEEHQFVNGAIAGASSDLLSYCFVEQIPENPDLVLAEFAVNDFPDPNALITYERLIRGLLDLPSQPAVINLEVVALVFNTIGWGDTQHQSVAQYYDTPVIALRNLIMPIIFANATEIENIFFTVNKKGYPETDLRHLSAGGHQLMANLTATYMSRVMCQMDERERLADLGIEPRRVEGKWMAAESLGELPKRNLMSFYDENAPAVPPVKPQCMSTTSKANPLKQDTQEGWVEWSWKDKPYIVGRKPGQKVRFKFHTAIGDVKLFFQRSKSYGLGKVNCWVDDNEKDKVKLDGWWDRPQSIPESMPIATDLPPGDHVLTCEVIEETRDPGGGHEFRITTVVAV